MENPFNKERCPWKKSSTCICRHKVIDDPVRTLGPWYHVCVECRKKFRCVPPRPTRHGDPPPENRPCRCIEWQNGKEYYCSNKCFWLSVYGSCEPHKWYL